MENRGQIVDRNGGSHPEVLFSAAGSGTRIWLKATGIDYQFNKKSYRFTGSQADINEIPLSAASQKFSVALQNSNPNPVVITENQSDYIENYYLPHCPQGILGVKSYNKIVFKAVYPKIDWVVYSNGAFMEYDFIVHPGGGSFAN